MNLTDALNAAEPSDSGVRLAMSSPQGDYIAVRTEDGKVLVRKTDRMHHSGKSVGCTGSWIDVDESIIKLTWRPV